MATVTPEYLPLKALAVYSGLSVRTLRTYLTHASRPLPHFRIGGKLLVTRTDFDAWARQFRTAPGNQVDAILADLLGPSGLKPAKKPTKGSIAHRMATPR